MGLLKFLRVCLTHCAGFVALAAALYWITAVAADPFPPDPVEVLRRDLKAPPEVYTNPEVAKSLLGVTDPKEKEKILEKERERLQPLVAKRLESIRTIGDLRRALSLPEFSQRGTGGLSDTPDVSDLPERITRSILAQRFRKEAQRILMEGNTAARLAALTMLSDVGTSIRTPEERSGIGRSFTPDLTAIIEKDQTPEVRQAAARTLGQVLADPGKAAAALGNLLRTGTPEDRRAAADGLLGMVTTVQNLSSGGGQTASRVGASPQDELNTTLAVLPEAARGVTDADLPVRRSSAGAIEQLTKVLYDQAPRPPRPEDFDIGAPRPELLLPRKDFDPLPLMKALQKQSAPLKQAAADPDPEVRGRIRRAYENMGVSRQRFQQVLTGAVEPGKPAADPLLEPLQAAVPVLAQGALDPNTAAKIAAIEALETLGAAAAPAVPALLQALRDRNPFVRWSALRTLGKIGPVPGQDAVPAIARELRDADISLTLAAAVALERYGPAARAAMPELIEALSSTDSDMRLASLHALEAIGTDSQPAIPALTRLLEDENLRVRGDAAELLGKFGPAAKSAEPALRRALNDSNADVRKAASDALLSVLSEK